MTPATAFEDHGRAKLSASTMAMRRGVGFAHSMSTHAKSSPAWEPSAARYPVTPPESHSNGTTHSRHPTASAAPA